MVKKGEHNLALAKDFPLSVIDRYKSRSMSVIIRIIDSGEEELNST